jgi:hypothetical protein
VPPHSKAAFYRVPAFNCRVKTALHGEKRPQALPGAFSLTAPIY